MIAWLGHAAFRIQGEKTIYIDPLFVKKGSLPADLILVTHAHPSHCSLDDIAKITTSGTVIVTNPEAGALLRDSGITCSLEVLRPGEKLRVAETGVDALPAYSASHPRNETGLGFAFTESGHIIYHAGDTGLIPEIREVRCSVALLPVSGGDVLNPAEAAEAAALLRPGIAIPMHYGSLAGTIEDARLFCRLAANRGVPVKLLSPP